MTEALKYFRSMLEDHLLMGEEELASRLKLMKGLKSDEWKPDVKNLIMSYDDTVIHIYGMSKSELDKMYNIFNYKVNK